MFCPNCGFNNEDGANFCKNCGMHLNYQNTTVYSNNSSSNNKNIIIICLTIVIILLIVAGTFLLISSDTSDESGVDVPFEDLSLKVNSVTFYSDGNPNTGETATINVGSNHAGEVIGVMTLYSRDGVRQNYPSDYENLKVDSDGDVVITDYTAMPRYPGHCIIKIKYNGQLYEYECNIGTYKGTQTIVPEEI